MQKNSRLVYIDVLNIIACFAVVMMHCNGIVHQFSNILVWKQALVIETIFYFAVPIFIMNSGATLLNYRERYNTKNFLKRDF